MSSMVINQTHVGCLVATVVLGRSARPFQEEMERLIRTNGPEWLVTRQKAIWTAALHLRNGDRESAQSLYRDNSISYHKGSMLPKGPCKPVVRGFVEASRPSVIRRYAAVLRFYTTMVLPDLSEKQAHKARNAITSPCKGVVSPDLLSAFRARGEMDRLFMHGDTVSELQTDPRVLAPNRYRYSRAKLSRADRDIPLRQTALSLLTERYLPRGLEGTNPHPQFGLRPYADGPIGRIGVIQEQGAKARVVAMPSALLQLAFDPLHTYLEKVDRRAHSSTSVLWDQQKAIYGLTEFMGQGNPAYSVDLSSATDRFPRSLSTEYLRGLGLGLWAGAIEEVSSQKWASPFGDISYGTGQPMGLRSSFPLFHLSNQVLCEEAEKLADLRLTLSGSTGRPGGEATLKKFPNGSTFYVLGDDVVFSDRRVVEVYRSFLNEMGVDVSDAKSFSGHVTEFAGFVVTEARGRPFAFRPYKPPSGNRVSNPVDFLAAMGTKARVINPRWAKLTEAFARTWSDRSPDLSPWVTMEKDPFNSQWELAVLDNELQVVSQKYPESTAANLPRSVFTRDRVVRPGGEVHEFIDARHESESIGSPKVVGETNRERLGLVPKHPKRTPTQIHQDPLLRRELDRQASGEAPADPPILDRAGPDNLGGYQASISFLMDRLKGFGDGPRPAKRSTDMDRNLSTDREDPSSDWEVEF